MNIMIFVVILLLICPVYAVYGATKEVVATSELVYYQKKPVNDITAYYKSKQLLEAELRLITTNIASLEIRRSVICGQIKKIEGVQEYLIENPTIGATEWITKEL